MVTILVDILGWAGAASLLLAYGLTSAGRLPSEGARFQLLNLFGALALATNSAYHGAWPSAGLNVVWIAIGLAALARGWWRRSATALDRAAAGEGSSGDDVDPL